MNAYVNLVMETVHTNLNDILQLKTQTKLLNDLVSEKDQVISSLTTELERAKENLSNNENLQVEMQRLRENASSWESEYNAMKNKVSHMDTLVNQHSDLQKKFVKQSEDFEKTETLLSELKQQLKEYQKTTGKKDNVVSSKVNINKEETKSTITKTQKIRPEVVVERPKEIEDDF